MSKRHRREFWKQLSAEIDTGRAAEEVARRHRVKLTTLRWWHWRLVRGEPATKFSRLPTLLPVVVKDLPPSGGGHVELLAGGVVVRVEVGTDVRYIAELVHRLERSC